MQTFARAAHKPAEPVPAGPACSEAATRTLPGAGHDFSRTPVHPRATEILPARSRVSSPGDRQERDADQLAAQIVAAPGSSPGRQVARAPSAASPVRRDARSPGRPLEPEVRAFMEPRFRHDFSQVRVHHDERARDAAQSIGARAYTSGSDVVFAAGQYAPHTGEGRLLLAHELAHVVQGPSGAGAREGAIQRKESTTFTPPKLIKFRDEDTDRIDDAYGKGTLDEAAWRGLVDTAEREFAAGHGEAAIRAYLTLYADIAKLGQAERVVTGSPAGINVVHGTSQRCADARPGLNFSLGNADQWGHEGTTAYVDETGKYRVGLNARGTLQPDVAVVLSRSVFKREKEQSLAILRHEMIHAGHLADDASAVLRSSSKDRLPPPRMGSANSELLAYVEGFMTMFHLTRPAPTAPGHPAYQQLLGAVDSGAGVLPWAASSPTVRSEALGRLQEYYCHALDRPHREVFESYVQVKLTQTRQDRLATGESLPEDFAPESFDEQTSRGTVAVDKSGAKARRDNKQDEFFRALQGIVARKCKGLRPSMTL